jgi:hypothetical protein
MRPERAPSAAQVERARSPAGDDLDVLAGLQAGGLDRLDDTEPYDLRNACLSTWLNVGVPAAQVAD